jgi:hypothetical protein
MRRDTTKIMRVIRVPEAVSRESPALAEAVRRELPEPWASRAKVRFAEPARRRHHWAIQAEAVV